MNFRCWAITIATGLVFALWEGLYSFGSERNLEEHAVSRVALAILIAVAVTAGFMHTLPRPLARRLLLLFAAPAWLGMVGTLDQQAGRVTTGSLLILYLSALTLAGVTIMVGLLPRRRRRPGAQAAGS